MYEFSFHPISQKFTRPVITNHGVWDVRHSIIIRLINQQGKVGWGEISPISWFGSETTQQALDFCHQLPREINEEIIFTIPDELPACQFGFESAQEWLIQQYDFSTQPNLTYSGLLPAGETALQQWQSLWAQGYRTFKCKIGVSDLETEWKVFTSLIQELPNTAKLRLDANGGLSYSESQCWLERCENIQQIEFIEQPLSVDKFAEMQKLSQLYSCPIALDESVANLRQIETCYQQGWRGIFVIKPGIVGSPSQLRKICQKYQIDTVFSSVFETEIGRVSSLQLATELSANHRAVGFGINLFFTSSGENWPQTLWHNC
ncbi:O-succinylbenzoic acid synthase [Richelia sinica FACHB-800]|uniref:o-succinylbenzoate synthase n=1 Tax=Richelia sinica FACHB-800 TaxID=1357546 RepID=A0A975Y2X7_9NOST|nr:o-succinylbenzoate synthase [Richelia sinica]MBD2667118.1 o-succinylbenzoate synthase [Richelia sinica FACHB-800]QXE21540.1 O-succinylbenzoic acid synthase [Richelia sinica FACHB-800]